MPTILCRSAGYALAVIADWRRRRFEARVTAAKRQRPANVRVEPNTDLPGTVRISIETEHGWSHALIGTGEVDALVVLLKSAYATAHEDERREIDCLLADREEAEPS
jgi:hypothetical protein